jgi:hypothetical protein
LVISTTKAKPDTRSKPPELDAKLLFRGATSNGRQGSRIN